MQDLVKLRKKIPLKKVLQHMHLGALAGGKEQHTYTYQNYTGGVEFIEDTPELKRRETTRGSMGVQQEEQNSVLQMSRDDLYMLAKDTMKETYKPHIRWADSEDVLDVISADIDNIILVGIGVGWCYPTRRTLESLMSLSGLGVRVFLVSSEKRKDVLQKFQHVEKSIIVGVPVTAIYSRGKLFKIQRPGFPLLNFISGPLNTTQVQEIIDAVRDALGGYNEGDLEISLKF
eukprot:TRINITY_DN5515_c0_g1_i1.p1 TRINITY_DN5515_c0_g1~~TRINITY_DN5515_c0_g1_i1.p1  ORF type:complete len:231 (-),score=43.16 TRINITY_DN5515_c0_g1_i1:223-915(-)